MKLGQNVEEIDPENLAKTACQNFYRFQRYSTAKGRLGGPSMDRTRKILDPQIFFSFLESRYFNSWKKTQNWKIEKFFPLWGHPGLTLRNFSTNFSKNENFLKKFPNGPIRKVITLKVKFEDIRKIFPLLGHQSWRLRKFLKFFEKKFNDSNYFTKFD